MNIPVIQKPDKYAAVRGFLENMVGGMLQQVHQQQVSQDIADITRWARSGGKTPDVRTREGAQLMMNQIMNTQQISPSQQISQMKLDLFQRTGDPKWILPGLFVREPFEATGMTAQEQDEYKQQLREKKTREPTEKPLTPLEVGRHEEAMKSSIDNAKVGFFAGVGRYNYPKENLLNAWEKYKTVSGYSNMPLVQKKQLWQKWKNKIKDRGNEAEFNPDDPEWKAASELEKTLNKVTKRPPKPTEYPDAVWNEQHQMWTVVRNGRLMGIK